MGIVIVILSLIGCLLNAHRRRACFVIFALSELLAVVCFWGNDWSMVVLNGIYLGMAVYGFRKWY